MMRLPSSPIRMRLLLVAEDGATKKDDLLKSIDMLSGTPLVGTVLEQISQSFSAQDIQIRNRLGAAGITGEVANHV